MIQGPWLERLSHPLVLASASPRRTWILSQLGIPHRVDPADIDEEAVRMADPAALVLELSRAKAVATSTRCPGELVLGADTVVYLSRQVLGKPRDAEEARKMLRSLSGREHVVWTGVHLALEGVPKQGLSVPAKVRFRDLSDREIGSYVDSGDPLDKAGAYGIQGAGLGLVSSIDGCFYGVAGLPVAATLQLLRAWQTPATKESAAA